MIILKYQKVIKELKMDKCREDFEIFWTARCCGLGVECNLTTLINGDYYDIKAYYAWIGWSERQKSMKAIKLPNTIKADNRLLGDNEYCSGYNQALRDCEKQITSAGYKVE